MSIKYVVENERQTRIIDEADVLVAGGGTAGAAAAIAAARSGVKVLLVEQFGSLGGSASEALVTPLMHTGIDGNPMCSSVSDEINRRLIELGYGFCDSTNNAGHFDPLMLKFILEEIAEEAGVKILYYTFVSDVIREGNEIKGLIVQNKGGRAAIMAKRIIDCTGDADVAVLSKVPYEKGNPETGSNQPISLRYIMSGIDILRFVSFMDEKFKGGYQYEPPMFHTAMVWERGWPLEPLFKEALESGYLIYEDGAYWQVFGIPGKQDSLAFNCPEIFDRVDGTNPDDLTNAQIYGKKAILRHLRFYKKYFKGFEKAYITQVAEMVGIRESRRIKGSYYITDEDCILNRKFSDYVVRSNYPVDIHGMNLINKHYDSKDKDPVPYYEIPYRALLPEEVENLIVAGRCISASFLAQSSIRIQPTVRALGEAAGIAAALSIKKGVGLAEIHGEEVRAEMERRGAKF
jgi:ribulose 1,5-bisphosphate synthetase/thiazole synthase